MQAAKLNLSIQQGATFRKRLVRRNDKGRPINLTGYTAKLQARTSHSDPVVLFELSTENSGIVITPATGVIDLYISDEETATFVFTACIYDLVLYAPDGDAYRLCEGKVTLSLGVTRV